MRKPIKILEVRQDKDFIKPIELAERLVKRRLERLQAQAREDPECLGWLERAKALHRLKGVPPVYRHSIDHLMDDIDAREPRIVDHPRFPHKLPRSETDKIEKLCISRHKRRRSPGHALPSKLDSAEKDLIREASASMRAVYMTEHDIDIVFADLHASFPWLAALNERAWKQARQRVRNGLPAGVGPLLVAGPPGIGKSSWSRAVARSFGVPSIDVDVGTTGGVFDIQGLARGWGNAEKGRLVSTIIAERIANPLMILDEIDAGHTRTKTTRGSLPGLYKVLMAAMEHSTAATWVCPFYQVPIDIRNVSWVATCNEYKHIDQALLDRMTIIELQDITRVQLIEFARKEAERRFGPEFAGAVSELMEEKIARGYRLSLRHITRILDRVEQAAQEPILH